LKQQKKFVHSKKKEKDNNKEKKRIIILGLTGSVSKNDLQKYQEADMDGCIEKGELLITAIQKALQKLQENPTEFVVLTELAKPSSSS